MKKLYSILLVLLLIAVGSVALAASTDGQGDLIARNAELAAFINDSGDIYVSGMTVSINTTKAASIVSIDPYRIVFFAKASDNGLVPEGRLMSLNLSDNSETLITDDASAACVYEDTIFYVSKANPTQLKKYDIDTKKTAAAFSSFETIQRLYATADGVVFTMVDNTGAYIYNTTFGVATAYNEEIADEIGVYDGFEVFLTDAQALMIKESGASSAKTVDTSVKNWAVIDDTVYYICGYSGSLSLRSYNVSNALWNNIMLLPANMEQQLTASNNSLFLLSGSDYTVYTLNTNTNTLSSFVSLPAFTSYALDTGKELIGYRIEAVSGQLNIYGELESDEGEMFSFVEFTGQSVHNNQNYVLLSAYPIRNEDTVWNLLQPAEQYTTLRRGSRGDAVAAIQQPLLENGYYDYYIDGIFGWRTERAIELLQADLGLTVNGVADAELQKIILANNFGAYDPYRQLVRGNRGLRVQEMQQRLRDLGYLADDADAIYGPRTQKAVALFQKENGLSETGTADSSTLKKLFSDRANVCSSYIDLRYGDSGYRVRELNSRLKELYYLEGKVGSTYNSATKAAILRFQEETGLKQTGIATEAVQKELFSKYAPEYSDYISLQRGDDNARVKNLQRRLKELGYYTDSIDGYFGKNTFNAVKKFQRAAGLTATGVADAETQRALFASDAPEYKEPVELGIPAIDLSAYTKYENGIYQISDSDTISGSINASWYADGPVGSFDMILKDDRGTVYMQNYGLSIDQNIISIPISTLSDERTYTLTVTANPNDGDDGAPTSASIQFIYITEEPEPDPGEIGTIGKLIISPIGNDIVLESGVYNIPGDTLSFSWTADGSVSGYVYSVADANENVLYSNANIDQTQELEIPASALSQDASYTLTVSAIPTNGTIDDATVESITFKLYVEAVTEPEQTEPEQAEPEQTEPEQTEPEQTEPEQTEPEQTEPEQTEPEQTEPEQTEPEQTEPEAQSAPNADMPVADAAAISIGNPVIAFDPAIGEAVDENGNSFIMLAESETLTISWYTEGEIAGYDVLITDAYGNEKSTLSTTSVYASLPTAYLERGAMYTLYVTAYSAEDAGITSSASMSFMLPVVETEPEYTPDEIEDAYIPDETEDNAPDEIEDAYIPEETAVPEPITIGKTTVSIAPALTIETDAQDNAIYYLEAVGMIEFAWHADGNIGTYEIRLIDESSGKDIELLNFYSESEELQFDVNELLNSGMSFGTIYRLEVTAIAAEDASVTDTATVWITIVAPEVEAEIEAEPEIAE